jgi:hypothetical protein
MASLGRVEIERRGFPALRLENGAEQERRNRTFTRALLASGPIRWAAG